MKADEFTGSTATAIRSRPLSAPQAAPLTAPAGPMIRFACGTCNDRLLVPARHAGRKGKCPNCGTVNRVPATSEALAPVVAPALDPVPADPVAPASMLFHFPAPSPLTANDAPLAEHALAFEDLDAAGMSPVLKLLLVGGIIGMIVLTVWVVFYLMIWSRMKLGA